MAYGEVYGAVQEGGFSELTKKLESCRRERDDARGSDLGFCGFDIVRRRFESLGSAPATEAAREGLFADGPLPTVKLAKILRELSLVLAFSTQNIPSSLLL
ncbi:hypothetical protein HPP92_020715 [Vanilla planifolia]|uniref:Uncharacterized protein n=1 Tax=Vanilla planifolia TaxID=51239 RepID=A0A835UGG1_VANPL|nr:hypothetical protein HPP92_020715 [Vanilla planifolia]